MRRNERIAEENEEKVRKIDIFKGNCADWGMFNRLEMVSVYGNARIWRI